MNTGPLAASAWLAERGVAPAQPKWFVEIGLFVGEDRSTRFQLDVYAEEWGIQVQHGDRGSWLRVTDVPFVHGRDDFDLMASRPRLSDVGRILTAIEQQLGLSFDREAPAIRSSIAEAYGPLRDWIAKL